MPANIEIKAKLKDPDALKSRAQELGGGPGTVIEQSDTFFNVPNCRLKLRELQNEPSQLIFYERSDQLGPKFSDYHITRTDKPEDLKTTLSKALGVKGAVKKRRLLFLVGQTRIHVDQVEGLGDFMELEVVLQEGQSAEDGQAIAEDLMVKLDVNKEDLIEGAYLDLLLKQSSKS